MKDYKKDYLLSSYAMRPNSGSEPGVGWEWLKAIDSLGKYNIYCIVEQEWEEEIKSEANKLNLNAKFYFVSIGNLARRLCWNQGSWSFYLFYRIWQIRVLIFVKFFLRKRFHIVHHLNMTGYREPGCLWLLNGAKFVLGPLGGLNEIPESLGPEWSFKGWIKAKLNKVSLMDPYVLLALRNANLLLGSNSSSVTELRRRGYDCILMNETGVTIQMGVNTQRDVDILWVGKNVPRKRFDLFKKIILKLDNSLLTVNVLGIDDDTSELFKRMEKVSRNEVFSTMRRTKILLFPSIDEGTPWSVLEALSFGCVVLAHDLAGMSDILPDEWLVEPKDERYSIEIFTHKIENILRNWHEEGGRNIERSIELASKHSWENKAIQLDNLIDNII